MRALAAKDRACCAFFAFAVTTEGDEVLWEAAVTDNDLARAVLEEYYAMPDTLVESDVGVRERLVERGVALIF